MLYKSILIVLLASCIFVVNGVDIRFGGRNLPVMDPFSGAPDAYVNVYYAPNITSQYLFVDRTADISDNYNPDWPEVFNFTYFGGSSQRLKLDMYDADWPDTDDYMGYVEVTLAEVVTAENGVLLRNLTGGEPGGGQVRFTLF